MMDQLRELVPLEFRGDCGYICFVDTWLHIYSNMYLSEKMPIDRSNHTHKLNVVREPTG